MTQAQKVTKLLNNEEFIDVILESFIKEGVLTNALHDNLSSEHVLDQLKARQILHSFLFDIIGQGEIAESNK